MLELAKVSSIHLFKIHLSSRNLTAVAYTVYRSTKKRFILKYDYIFKNEICLTESNKDPGKKKYLISCPHFGKNIM